MREELDERLDKVKKMNEQTKDMLAIAAFIVTLGLAFGAGALLSLHRPLPEPVLVDPKGCADLTTDVRGMVRCFDMPQIDGKSKRQLIV